MHCSGMMACLHTVARATEQQHMLFEMMALWLQPSGAHCYV